MFPKYLVLLVIAASSSGFAETRDLELKVEHAVQLTFKTALGTDYVIEQASRLDSNSWFIVGDPIIGHGGAISRTFVTTNNANIYRVQEVNLGQSLAAYYPFNGSAHDESTNDNHGTIVGAVLATNRFGESGKAMQFDGVDDYIEIPDSTVFDSQDFTMSLWFKADRLPEAADFLFSKANEGGHNFEIHLGSAINGPSAIRFLPKGTQIFDSPAGSFTTNEWHHVVAVFQPSSNRVQVLVNGRNLPLSGSPNVTASQNNALPARIGRRTDNTLAFKGTIDDVRVYSRGLSETEARALFIREPASLPPTPTIYAPYDVPSLTSREKTYYVNVPGQGALTLRFPGIGLYEIVQDGETEIGTVSNPSRSGDTWNLFLTPAAGQDGAQLGNVELKWTGQNVGVWTFTSINAPPESGTFAVAGLIDTDGWPIHNDLTGRILRFQYAGGGGDKFTFTSTSAHQWEDNAATGTYTFDHTTGNIQLTIPTRGEMLNAALIPGVTIGNTTVTISNNGDNQNFPATYSLLTP